MRDATPAPLISRPRWGPSMPCRSRRRRAHQRPVRKVGSSACHRARRAHINVSDLVAGEG